MTFENRTASIAELLADEPILWEGHPSAKLRFSPMDLLPAVFGTIFLLQGLTVAVTRFPLGALAPQLWFGAYVAVGRLFFERKVRRNTKYFVTSSRAIEQRAWPKPILRSVVKLDCEIRIEPDNAGRSAVTLGVIRSVPFAVYGVKRILPMRFEYIPDLANFLQAMGQTRISTCGE